MYHHPTENPDKSTSLQDKYKRLKLATEQKDMGSANALIPLVLEEALQAKDEEIMDYLIATYPDFISTKNDKNLNSLFEYAVSKGHIAFIVIALTDETRRIHKSIDLKHKYDCLDLAVARKDKLLMHKLMNQLEQFLPSLDEVIVTQDWEMINYHIFNLPTLKAGQVLSKQQALLPTKALMLAIKKEIKTVDADLSHLLLTCIENLLEVGAPPGIVITEDPNANMPLHLALESRHPLLPGLLLKYMKPDEVHIPNRAGKTALQMAIENGYWPMVKTILSESLAAILDNLNHFEQHQSSYEATLSNILQINQTSIKEIPLVKDCIDLLMEHPFSLTVINDNLAKVCNAEVIDWKIVDLLSTKARETRKIEQAKEAVFVPPSFDEALYHAYLARRSVENIKPTFLLDYICSCLEAGAKPSYVHNPDLKNTLIHLAIGNNDEPLALLLLEHASLDILYLVNYDDNTAFSLAAATSNWSMLQSMLTRVTAKKNQLANDDAYQKVFSVAIDKLGNGDHSPLLWDCIFLLKEVSVTLDISAHAIQILMEKAKLTGNDTIIERIRAIPRSTSLHRAIEANDGNLLAIPSRIEDMEIKNMQGQTPILFAASLGHWHLVRELILNTVHTVNDTQAYGNTLASALLKGQTEIVLLLLEHGTYISPNAKLMCLKIIKSVDEAPFIQPLVLSLLKQAIQLKEINILHILISKKKYAEIIARVDGKTLGELLDYALFMNDMTLVLAVLEIEKSKSSEGWIPLQDKLHCIKSIHPANQPLISQILPFFLEQAIELKNWEAIVYIQAQHKNYLLNADVKIFNQLFNCALSIDQTELAVTLLDWERNPSRPQITQENKLNALQLSAERKNKTLVCKLITQVGLPMFSDAVTDKNWVVLNYYVLAVSQNKSEHYFKAANLCLMMAVKEEFQTVDAELSNLLMTYIENLLDAEAPTSGVDGDGNTPLHLALEHKHPLLPGLLLKYSKPDEVHIANKAGNSVLKMAIENHYWPMIKTILTESLAAIFDNPEHYKKHHVSYEKALAAIMEIQKLGVSRNESLRLEECIHFLMEHPFSSADINAALEKALKAEVIDWKIVDILANKICSTKKAQQAENRFILPHPDEALYQAYVARNLAEDVKPIFLLSYIRICLEAGAKLSYLNAAKNSVLHLAMENRDESLVSLLLEYASLDDLHLASYDDQTALDLAVTIGNWAMLHAMLVKSKTTYESPHYNSPVYKKVFSMAIQALKHAENDELLWRCIFQLQKLIIAWNVPALDIQILSEKAHLTGNNSFINLVLAMPRATPLHQAIAANDDNLLEIPSCKIDMEIKNADGETPIVHAAMLGHWHLVRALVLNIPVKENDPADYGKTLALAIKKGEIETALLLIKHGNPVSLVDKRNCLECVAKQTDRALKQALCQSILEQDIQNYPLAYTYPWIIEYADSNILRKLFSIAASNIDMQLMSYVLEVEKSRSPKDWIPLEVKYYWLKAPTLTPEKQLITLILPFFLEQALAFKNRQIIDYLRTMHIECILDANSEIFNQLFQYAVSTKQIEFLILLLKHDQYSSKQRIKPEDKHGCVQLIPDINNRQLATELLYLINLPTFEQAIHAKNWILINYYATNHLVNMDSYSKNLLDALMLVVSEIIQSTDSNLSKILMTCINNLLNAGALTDSHQSLFVMHEMLNNLIQAKKIDWELLDLLINKARQVKDLGEMLHSPRANEILHEAFLARNQKNARQSAFLLNYMEICLKSGATLSLSNNPDSKNTMLHLAIENQDDLCVALFVKYASLDALHLVNNAGQTAFSMAADRNNWLILKLLLTAAKSKTVYGSLQYDSPVYQEVFSKIIHALKNEPVDALLWDCMFLVKELSITLKISELENRMLMEKAKSTNNTKIIESIENIARPTLPKRKHIRDDMEIKIEEGVNEFFEVAATSQKNPAPEARKAAKPAQDLPTAKPDLLFGNRNPKKCLKIARWVLRHYRMNNMGAGEGLTRSYSFLVLLDKATPISMHWKMIALGAFLNQDIPKSIKGEKLAGLIKTQLKKAGLVEYIKNNALPVAMDALGLLNDAQLTKVQTVILKRANKGEYKSFDSVNDLNLLPEGLDVSGLKPKPL